MKHMYVSDSLFTAFAFETEDYVVTSFQRVLIYCLFISFAIPLVLEIPIGDFRLPIYVFDIPLFALLFLWYMNICVGKAKVRISSLDVVFVLFLAWISITAFTGLDPLYSTRKLMLWVRAYFLFTLLYNTKLRAGDLLRVISLLLFVQVFVALVQFATQSNIGALNQYFGQKGALNITFKMGDVVIKRLQGTLPNPNMLGLWFILLLPFIQSHLGLRYTKRFATRLLGLLWAAGIVALLLTLSRAAIAAGVAGAIVVITLRNKYIKKIRRSHCPLLWLLIAVSIVMFVMGYWSPLKARFSTLEDQKRACFLREAIHVISEHPLLGVGYDNFVLAIPKERFPFIIRSRAGVHNIPLKITAETGIPGGILFMFLIILLLWRTYSSLKHVPTYMRPLLIGMVAGIMSCAIAIQFDVIFNHHSILPLFFALAGTTLGSRRFHKGDGDVE